MECGRRAHSLSLYLAPPSCDLTRKKAQSTTVLWRVPLLPLRAGFPTDNGWSGVLQTGKYQFGANGDSSAIFVRVFGTDNPFAELFQACYTICLLFIRRGRGLVARCASVPFPQLGFDLTPRAPVRHPLSISRCQRSSLTPHTSHHGPLR